MDLLAAETAPFAVDLGLTIAIAVLEVVGLLIGRSCRQWWTAPCPTLTRISTRSNWDHSARRRAG